MRLSLQVRVEAQRLLRELKRYPGVLKAEIQPALRLAVRNVISSGGKVPGIVQLTPPHGGVDGGVRGVAAKKQGESAVARDIGRVYDTAGKIYARIKGKNVALARAFWRAVSAKNWPEAQRMASKAGELWSGRFEPWDNGAAHKVSRSSRDGRVKVKRPVSALMDSRQLRAYIKKKQGKVGLLASSLVSAPGAGRLGPLRGVPGWVRRHSGTWGSVRQIAARDGEVWELSLTRTAGADMQRRMSWAVAKRREALVRQMPFVVMAAARKAGLLVR